MLIKIMIHVGFLCFLDATKDGLALRRCHGDPRRPGNDAPPKETRGVDSFEVDFRDVKMIVAEGFPSEVVFGIDDTLGPFGEDWGDGLQLCDEGGNATDVSDGNKVNAVSHR